jgi:hypothetical protein
LEMLNELVPGSFPIAEMVNPTNKYFVTEVRIASEAARTLGRELLFVNAGTAAEFAPAFEEIRQAPRYLTSQSRSSPGDAGYGGV